MIKTHLLILLTFISSSSLSQHYFEGVISFKTSIKVTKSAKKKALVNLINNFEDSLQMYYSKEGNFKRKYFNNDSTGLDYQTYNAEEGKLFIKKKNSYTVQTSDVSINSLDLISLKKLNNEMIMNLDCNCYEYNGKLKDSILEHKAVSLTFCFSNLLPKINVKSFEKYNVFFINDYFKANERPYLKYIMKTEDFTLSFIAVKIKNIELNKIKI